MSPDPIIRIANLGKCFKIYANPWHRALEWMSPGKRTYHQPFWALQDISFEVKRGEFLGIIGQNGAGKSTLLKILSGVLQPTSGTYHIHGRVLSMIELGMDFNPYLTGRENVLRSTELLGFPDGYVQSRMEQIAEFSELGEFFDRPVRLYSTGMSARLAFSIYAFLECDVLILDEVLAVGDIFFKQKCFARLEDLIAKGTTIILVTHQLEVIRQYCDQVIVLDQGQELYRGKPGEALWKFHQIKSEWSASMTKSLLNQSASQEFFPADRNLCWPANEVFTPAQGSENGQTRLTRFAVCNERGEPCLGFIQGDQAYFYGEFQLKQDIGVPIIGFRITNQFNVLVHAKNSLHHKISMPKWVNQGDYVCFCRKITLSLAPGEYTFGLGLAMMPPDDYARLREPDGDDFTAKIVRLGLFERVGLFNVMPRTGKGAKKSHGGICDLPGDCYVQLVSNR
jgi:lipopolysaccharide transport system ATP-binding protein